MSREPASQAPSDAKASAGSVTPAKDGLASRTVEVHAIVPGSVPWAFLGHANVVEMAVISPDGQRILSASVDGTLILWELGVGENTASKRSDRK